MLYFYLFRATGLRDNDLYDLFETFIFFIPQRFVFTLTYLAWLPHFKHEKKFYCGLTIVVPLLNLTCLALYNFIVFQP